MFNESSRSSQQQVIAIDDNELVEKTIRSRDPEDPHTWSKSQRWCMTLILSYLAFLSFWGAGAYSPAIGIFETRFHASQEVAVLGTAIYPLGFTIGPLLGAPISEIYGRRIVFLVCVPLTAISACGVALSYNMPMVLIFRFLTALFVSGPFAVAGGAVSDLWAKEDRALPILIYSTAPNLGSTIGPVVGGLCVQFAKWQWTFWIQAILYAVCTVLCVFFVPESYVPVLRGEKTVTVSATQKIKTALTRPFALLLQEPIVFALSVYLAFVYGLLFCSFSALPVEYSLVRGWNVLDSTLPFLAISIGIFIGAFASPLFKSFSIKNPAPEGRLYKACAGAILMPISLFWWAGCSGVRVHPAGVIIAGSGIGCSMLLLFLAITDYLVETYLIYAASVLAANGAFRTLVSAIFPLFSHQMFVGLTPLWAMSTLGFVSLVLAPIPFILIKYGSLIRLRGKYTLKT